MASSVKEGTGNQDASSFYPATLADLGISFSKGKLSLTERREFNRHPFLFPVSLIDK